MSKVLFDDTTCLFIAIFFTLSAIISEVGAPIPIDPHYIVGVDKVAVHNSCVLIYDARKAYQCDRIYSNGFQQ